MRGKRCAQLVLLSAALFVAGAAAQTSPPAVIVVLDASSSMSGKADNTTKIAAVRSELSQAVATYRDRLSFGLVAFGHRKASNCADSEILAKPGEFSPETQDKLLEKIKPKGQAPVAAALSDAVKAGPAQRGLDIVLIADGPDSCDADVCSTAAALKEKSPGLRIHVIAFGGKAEESKGLACVAAATGGGFMTAKNAAELKQGLVTALDIAAGGASQPVQVGAIESPSQPTASALPVGTARALPIDLDAQKAQGAPAGALPPGTVATQPIDLEAMAAKAPPAGNPAAGGESAVHKSVVVLPQVKRVQSVPIEPPAPPPPPPVPKTAAASPKDIQLPVPVTFKALVSEQGPKLESGLTWRVYAAKPEADGQGFKLLSTHREAMPTAALLPGEYLVNAAYGLSNLTKKIKVESGRSLEETFVLNTGGLKLAAILASGEALPESAVKFDILTDEEDQFGKRHVVLSNAKPGVTIRLNAGAYRIESLYGDANAVVRADVTVEPGKITEATIKQTGAKITFKLVQTLGGEALTDTKWTILTSAGDVVKENAGALPTHILAPGSYAVIADHGGLSFTRKFSVEAGNPKQVEVVVADGPASPEEVKALTDPPEPPAPDESIMAGDGPVPSPEGGMAFDGFSPAPSNPAGVLINPGVLLRGTR
ncbi:MAG TPA: VWA domain-containing protein [Methyloceanibacter sp.]|nr:VWA domain-containing protein [Methyloceanibacter sp.]